MSNNPDEKKEEPGYSKLRLDMYREAVHMNGITQIAVFLGCHATIVCMDAVLLPEASLIPAMLIVLSVAAALGSLLYTLFQMRKEEGRIHGYYMHDEKFMPAALAVLPAGLAGLLLLAAMATEIILRIGG